MLTVGDVFKGEFEIEAKIGEGGFATVYRAKQRRLGRMVAVKLLRLDDDEAQKRFELEAKLLSRLRDPAVVTMHDFGDHEGTHYMILEFVEGRTLRDVIDRNGALDAHRVVGILEQVTSALVEAHDCGVLHRDIKPDNIMLFDHYGRTDRVKVLDFGIAKLLSPKLKITDAGPVTISGKTIGTPRYMAPELLYDGTVSDASDIFSLGMVVYEMLTGERAVKSTNGIKVIERMLDANPFVIPPGAGVPEPLRALVNSMLLKRIDERIGTAESLAAAIRALPKFDSATAVVSPDELMQLRGESEALEEFDDQAPTVSDVEVVPPPRVTQRLEVERFDPVDKSDKTPADVDIAVRQLKEDAEARMINDAAPAPATPQPAEPSPPLAREPVNNSAAYVVSDEGEVVPRQHRTRSMPSARQIAGFGVLAVALILVVGFLAGVVGVKTTIEAGHPLACGFGRSAIVMKNHFEAFGVRLFPMGEEIRCQRLE